MFQSPYVHKINSLITIISSLLLLVSLFLTNNTELNFERFGLISFLPAIYIFSVEILLVSSLISLFDVKKNKYLLSVQTILLLFILTAIPLLIEGTPRFDACFKMGGEVDYVARNGHLAPDILRYCNWPAVDILGAFILILMDLNIITLLSYTPLVSQIIYLLLAFSLFNKTLTDKKQVWIASWIFILANWLNQDYFSPQNGAFIVYLTVLLSIFLLIKQNERKSSFYLVILILISSLVIYHILTPFVFGLNLLFISIICKFNKKLPLFNNLIIILVVFFLSWQVYGAELILPQVVHSLQNSIQSGDITTSTSNLIMAGSVDHKRVVNIRLSCSILMYLMAFLGAFHIFIIERNKSLVSIIFLSLMASALGMFSVGGYGGEIFIRVLLFCLLPIAYFTSYNMNNKYFAVLFFIFLLIFPTLHMTTRYGNEKIDYTAPTDLKGSNFFLTHAPQKSTILGVQNEIFKVKSVEQYHILPYKSNNSFENSQLTSNLYFCVSNKGDQSAIFLMNSTNRESYRRFKLNLDNYNKIYANRNFYLYTY